MIGKTFSNYRRLISAIFILVCLLISAGREVSAQMRIAQSFAPPLSGSFILRQDHGNWVAYPRYGLHLGEDWITATELPVFAAGDGIVEHARSKKGYGYVVIISHHLPSDDPQAPTVTTLYGHLRQKDLVAVGTIVRMGDRIGYLSSDPEENGGYDFTHLHFAVRKRSFLDACHSVSHGWTYAGYSTQYDNCKKDHKLLVTGPEDKKHGDVLADWLDPSDFVSARQAPTMLDASIYPAAQIAENSLTFVYKIQNRRSTALRVRLGASIRRNGSRTWIEDPARDKIETISSGTNNFSRSFIMPAGIQQGRYDVAWTLLSEDGAVIFTRREDSAILTIPSPVIAPASPALIGINFVGGGYYSGTPAPLVPEDMAGVISAANWNNVAQNIASGYAGNLVDNSGLPTTATVRWSSHNTWSNQIAAGDPNSRMMKGYLDNAGQTETTIVLTGVPYERYSIYVYFSGDNRTSGTIGSYKLNGSTTILGKVNAVQYTSTFIRASGTDANDPNSIGNYLLFQNVSGPSFTLTCSPVVYTAPINGMQIVQEAIVSPRSDGPIIPEPTEWIRQFGTERLDFGRGVATYADDVYLVGSTSGTLPGQTNAGDSDAFIRKYDIGGNVIWTRQFGTNGPDGAVAVAADSTGVYVAGSTNGSLAGQPSAGQNDAFLQRYDFNGNIIWTRQFGSPNSDGATGLVVSTSGIYIIGFAHGDLFGQTRFWENTTFLRRYDTDGDVIWTRQFATLDGFYAMGVAEHDSGIYLVGNANKALPGQGWFGGSDAFLQRYDINGNEVWTRQFGTAGEDGATAVAANATGIYMVGRSGGSLSGQTSAGQDDVFVRKYDICVHRSMLTTQSIRSCPPIPVEVVH